MDLAQGHQAVEIWQQQGMPLEATTAPTVREVIGSGSYTTMTAYLRPIRGESASVLDESEDPGQRWEALPQPGPRPTLLVKSNMRGKAGW
jgi:hypothetical protein